MPTAKLYLPKTADDYADTLESVKRRVADAYDGFTAYDAAGGWVADDGTLVEEPVTVIETAAGMGADRDTMASFMMTLAGDVKMSTDEDTVMVVVDGDKILL